MSGRITPSGAGLIEFIADGGSASGLVTDDVGYFAGESAIVVSSRQSGSLSPGQRIRFANDDNYYTLQYGIADTSGTTLPIDAVVFDTTEHLVGDTVITFSASSISGIIEPGNLITIAGDPTRYTALNFVNTVIGGVLAIEPALKIAIPASTSVGVTVYNAVHILGGILSDLPAATVSVYSGGELKRGWGHGLSGSARNIVGGDAADVFADWNVSGEVSTLWIDKGYSLLNVSPDKNIVRTISTSGEVHTRSMSEAELYDMGMSLVEDAIAWSDYNSTLSIIESMNTGKIVVWFMDYKARPSELYFCVNDNDFTVTRLASTRYHSFGWRLRVVHSRKINIPNFGQVVL